MYKVISFVGSLLDGQMGRDIDQLHALYQSYCDTDEANSFDPDDFMQSWTLDQKISLLSLIDTYSFCAVMKTLKNRVESESDGDSYKDGFEEIFTKDALIRNIIMDGDTTDLNDILDLIEGISPEFKLDDALTKDINGVLTLYEEALNVFLVENGRAAKPLGEFIRFRSKKKALEGCFKERVKVKRSLKPEGQPLKIIKSFNTAYNKCLTALDKELHLGADEVEKLKQTAILDSYETQITDLGRVDQNGREINYPTFSIEESAQTLFHTSYKALKKVQFKELAAYCELILLKTNDSAPPAATVYYTTFVIKMRFGQLRLGLMSIKEGPLLMYYAENIGSNDHSSYRDDMKSAAHTEYNRYLERKRLGSSEESSSPVSSDGEGGASATTNVGSKPRNRSRGTKKYLGIKGGGGQKFANVANGSGPPGSVGSSVESRSSTAEIETPTAVVSGAVSRDSLLEESNSVKPGGDLLTPSDLSDQNIKDKSYKFAFGFFIGESLFYKMPSKGKGNTKVENAEYDKVKSSITISKRIQSEVSLLAKSLNDLSADGILVKDEEPALFNMDKLSFDGLNIASAKNEEQLKALLKKLKQVKERIERAYNAYERFVNSDSFNDYKQHCPKFCAYVETINKTLNEFTPKVDSLLLELQESFIKTTTYKAYSKYKKEDIPFNVALDVVSGSQDSSFNDMYSLYKEYKKGAKHNNELDDQFIEKIIEKINSLELDSLEASVKPFFDELIEPGSLDLVEKILSKTTSPTFSIIIFQRFAASSLDHPFMYTLIPLIPKTYTPTGDQLKFLLENYLIQNGDVNNVIDEFLLGHIKSIMRDLSLRDTLDRVDTSKKTDSQKALDKHLRKIMESKDYRLKMMSSSYLATVTLLYVFNYNNDEEPQTSPVVYGPLFVSLLASMLLNIKR